MSPTCYYLTLDNPGQVYNGKRPEEAKLTPKLQKAVDELKKIDKIDSNPTPQDGGSTAPDFFNDESSKIQN